MGSIPSLLDATRQLGRHGLVVDEILAEAEKGDYDLVVIGAHPRQGWQGYLLDNLAHKILTKINLPVLVVK